MKSVLEGNAAPGTAMSADGSPLETQGLLQAVFTIETVGVLFFNLDGSIVDANPAFERMCGYSRDELCASTHWKQMTDPDFFEITFKVAERLAVEGRTPPYEKQMVRKDGTRWWGLFAPTRLSGTGLGSKCAEFVLDITETKNAETALRESEERFRVLVEGVAQAVWETDARGLIVTDSPSWRSYTGQSIEEWLAQEWINVVHPDDRDYALHQWVTALREKRTVSAEFRLMSATGDWRWTNVRASPIVDTDGTIRKWVGINIDIDNQRRTQEALRASEQWLATALSATRMGTFDYDPGEDRMTLTPASAEVFGFVPGARLPATADAFDIIHPEDAERHRTAFMEAVRNGAEYQTEYRVIRPRDGAVAWIAERGSPVVDAVSGQMRMRGIHWDISDRRHAEELLASDITERKRAEEALRASEERLRALFDSMNEAFALLEAVPDERGNIVDYRFIETNPAFYRQTGLDDPRGQTKRELFPDIEPIWLESYTSVLRTGKPIQLEEYVSAIDRWLAASGTRLGGPGSMRLAVVFTDITERKRTEEQIRHASLHDGLTGLPNRTMLFEYASHLLPRNRRANQSAAVLFLDLDRFKPINDTHGHLTGDLVLKEVARRLVDGARAEDIVVRLGGDEFVILLQDLKSSAAAADVAMHILHRISQPYHIGDLSLSLSTSIGISLYPDDGHDIDTLISHADMAMYQAKQAGNSNFQFYSPEHSSEIRRQRVIEEQLKSALRKGTFHLYYQPVLDVETGEIVSAEALLRCQETDIGPDRFVPIAEATGIINRIGRWLLAEAACQHKTWLEHGLPLIPIAVNVSVVEFRDRDFPNRFESTIREHGLGTNALQLEVTETAVMDDIEYTVVILSRLRELGVKILLDDFGTGHSSLAYLARLPLNKVKIDKSFVTPLDRDQTSRVVTNAMIALSRTLGLEVVAEGVETESALQYIRAHGCTQVQGYYVGKPMPGDAFEEWYRERRQRLQSDAQRQAGLH